MNVDDSRDRIYIANIDDELADIESDEEKMVFIPDIEKRLMKIPKSVLYGKESSSAGNEVVLYGVPESLSVPPDKDIVRKAIIESRARAQSSPQTQTVYTNGFTNNQQPHEGFAIAKGEAQDEDDAMDLG